MKEINGFVWRIYSLILKLSNANTYSFNDQFEYGDSA